VFPGERGDALCLRAAAAVDQQSIGSSALSGKDFDGRGEGFERSSDQLAATVNGGHHGDHHRPLG
jgi:hypothetical protein